MNGVETYRSYGITVDMKEIPLSGRLGLGKTFFVDDDDYERVSKHTWWLDGAERPQTDIAYKRVLIGRFILKPKRNLVVDHIDGNQKNNTRGNLRACSQSSNQRNRTKLNKNSTSGHRGVSWDKFRGKWVAQLSLKHKHIYLGRFDKMEDAIESVRTAVKERHGKYANYSAI